MKRPTIRKPWERHRVITSLEGQQLKTDQSSGNDTDVNHIVARFQRTGEMPKTNPEQPVYDDVTGLQADLTEILEKGAEARKQLVELKQQHEAAQTKEIEAQTGKIEENMARIQELEQQLAAKNDM